MIMKPITTKTLLAAGGAILVVAAAFVVKSHYFPAVNEAYFTPDSDLLRRVPAGLAVVRPSHSGRSANDSIERVTDDGVLKRAVGYGVTFRELLAEAYDCAPGRVVLPTNPPNGRFDFLVTTAITPREHLKTAIKKELGFTARTENRTMDILKLELADPSHPGLTISPDGEHERLEYKNGKLYFTHKSIGVLLKGLEIGLAQPVVDDTGLSGRYDFSVAWNRSIQDKMHEGAFQREGVQKVLRGLGLRLEPDTETMDMVVVEKSK